MIEAKVSGLITTHKLELDKNDHVPFGDVARSIMGQQCQYGSRYINGLCEGYPPLGEGLRFTGDDRNYHSFTIHVEDVEEFVRRHFMYVNRYSSESQAEIEGRFDAYMHFMNSTVSRRISTGEFELEHKSK